MKLSFFTTFVVAAVLSTSVHALVATKLDPHKDMTMIAAALDRMNSPKGQKWLRQLEKSGINCEQCRMIVGVISSIANSTEAMKDVRMAMQKSCINKYGNGTKDEKTCELVADIIVWALPKIFKGLKYLSWDVPLNLCALVFNVCKEPCCSTPYTPEQVFLSLAHSTDFSQMRVSWVTLNVSKNPSVRYGEANTGGNNKTAVPSIRTYYVGSWLGTLYSAVMTDLKPDTQYVYTVGSDEDGRTQQFSFRTFPTNIGTPQRPLRFLNVADMGWMGMSDDTVRRMTRRVAHGEIDMMVHNGDISYADGQFGHWDNFMRKIQPISSAIPYMTTPGNHEFWYNFTAYRNRLSLNMPPPDAGELEGSMHWQMTVGPVKFLMMNSETWIDTPDIAPPQVAWADRVLSQQDRSVTPWLFVFHHRPLYCSNSHTTCNEEGLLLRWQVESVYLKHKVDLVNTAHVHYFIRSYPIANDKVIGQSYVNPKAPVYIVNGAAGNHELNDEPGINEQFPAGTREVGYSICTVYSDKANNYHFFRNQFYISATDALFDDFNITKNM